mmetsp:Transcript_28400/g.88483  ORF Transcript_28400/g.88483 Transcript_28400/m.88483 type:complete len:459 (-) Transcript_28400:36-1412(-)
MICPMSICCKSNPPKLSTNIARCRLSWPMTRSFTPVTQDSRLMRCGSFGSFQRSMRRSLATKTNCAALLLTFLSVVRRVRNRWLRCCIRSSCGVMAVSWSLLSFSTKRAWPSCSTCPVFDCMTLPLKSRMSSRRWVISSTTRCTSESLAANCFRVPSASSTSPSTPLPLSIRRRSPKLCWIRVRLVLKLLAVWLWMSACAEDSPTSARASPAARTQQSPSVHSREPSAKTWPLKVSSCSVVETESWPQISNSDSSPQCHTIIASLMTQRGAASCFPTQVPSKPSALHNMELSREMPALKASFIWVSAKTSSAFSFRFSKTDIPSEVPLSSNSSHSFEDSSHSLEATSIASPAEAVSLSLSFSRPRPWRASRSRARVLECILKSSAARPRKRSTSGRITAVGQRTSLGLRKAAPQGKSTTRWPVLATSPTSVFALAAPDASSTPPALEPLAPGCGAAPR